MPGTPDFMRENNLNTQNKAFVKSKNTQKTKPTNTIWESQKDPFKSMNLIYCICLKYMIMRAKSPTSRNILCNDITLFIKEKKFLYITR